MKANYPSRGYQVYGDVDNVQKDAATIKEILARQGVDLLLEVIANHVGEVRLKFKLDEKEVQALKSSLRLSLTDLINERT